MRAIDEIPEAKAAARGHGWPRKGRARSERGDYMEAADGGV